MRARSSSLDPRAATASVGMSLGMNEAMLRPLTLVVDRSCASYAQAALL